MLGAAILACAENFGLAIDWAPLLHLAGIDAGTAHIPASYREAIPFAILIGVLLVRPQGILGHRSA